MAIYSHSMLSYCVVVAEWLRRWTRNPLGSPRAGSNPADYDGNFNLRIAAGKEKLVLLRSLPSPLFLPGESHGL